MTDRTANGAGSPQRVTRFVVAVAVVAVGVLVLTVPSTRSMGVDARAVLLLLLGTASIVVPLRFHHGDQVSGFSLVPAIAFTLGVIGPDGSAVLAAGIVAMVGSAIDTRSMAKTVFNASQNVIGATLGILTARVVLGGPLVGDLLLPRPFVALVLGAVAYGMSTLCLVTEVLHRSTGDPRQRLFGELVRPTLWMAAGDVTGALLLIILAERSAVATLLAIPVFAGIQLSYRGYAADQEAAQQAELLHATSRRLLEGTVDERALHAAVGGLAGLFDADRVGLVVAGDGPDWLTDVAHEAVARDEPVVRHIPPAVLAVPVRVEGETVGAIGISGPRGLRSWGSAHRDLLATVASEVAATLHARRLLARLERERASLAAETNKLTDVLASASDGIVVLSDDGRVEACNLAMQRLLGTTEDPVGRLWSEVLPLTNDDGFRIVEPLEHPLTTALARQTRLEQARAGLRCYDGQTRWVRCSVAPVVSHEGSDGVVLVVVDLTREHEVEELRSDFIATVSHELRTPLTPLRGFLGVLELHGSSLPQERVVSMVEAMQKQVDRLADLIGDLLQVSEMERLHLELEPLTVDLHQIVNQVVDVEAVAADERGRVVVVGSATEVHADPDALRRVVRSLVSNGLKHTAGILTLVVGGDGVTATVCAADEGPRIPASARDIVFEPFRRLGDHLHRTQGAGLGLAVGRSLAEAMGGRLDLHATEDGRGNVFEFGVPVGLGTDQNDAARVRRIPVGQGSGRGDQG